jgi:hypothetical protein
MKSKCRHQFFEVSKIQKMSKSMTEMHNQAVKTCREKHRGYNCSCIHSVFNDINGVLVICALCELQKDLYEKEVE